MVKREPLHIVGGNVNWSNHYEKQYRGSSKKLKTEWPYDSAIPFLDIYPKEKKTGFQRDISTLHVYHNIIHNSQDMKSTQISINGWMDKKNVVHVHNGLLFSHEKGGYPAICNNMNGPWAYYIKWDKSDKDKDCIISLLCGI